jgi:hypothetical protein
VKTRFAAAGAILLLIGTSASAHRLDEYLQATTISVEKESVWAEIRLAPGVAVCASVLATIDTDGDEVISAAEQRSYAERVLGDVSLTIDGERLQLRLASLKFPPIEEMKEGRGEIQLAFEAEVTGGGPNRRLIFENQHQSRIAAYLVNCLVPCDPDIRVTAQDRNYEQSFYQLDYVQADVRSGLLSFSWWSGAVVWLGMAALAVFGGLALLWRRRARSASDAIGQE